MKMINEDEYDSYIVSLNKGDGFNVNISGTPDEVIKNLGCILTSIKHKLEFDEDSFCQLCFRLICELEEEGLFKSRISYDLDPTALEIINKLKKNFETED